MLKYADIPMQEKVSVRDTLWKNPDLIDAYIEKNPDNLSVQEMDIIGKWKRFVSGDFQIFRCRLRLCLYRSRVRLCMMAC
jgi:hypothetical protein